MVFKKFLDEIIPLVVVAGEKVNKQKASTTSYL